MHSTRSLFRAARAANFRIVAAAAALAGCGSTATRSDLQAARVTSRTVYYHATTSSGPSLITGDGGALVDERRAEPFGAAIDSQPGPVDDARDPHNTLNKETDVHTGWSDHGARWMAPETGRWLTPDPPVKAPDPKFMSEPWGLHPYQYVEQNPILFWDPDGRDASLIQIRCDACVINNEGQVRWPSKFEAGVENAVAPITTLVAAKADAFANAKLPGTGTPILPEASRIAKPLNAASKLLDLTIAAKHAVQYNLAETQEEKDQHAGGAVTSVLGLTPLAVPIAIWGLFDSDMNARVGRGMHEVSDAVAVALQPIDLAGELRHMQRMAAGREIARARASATSGPECKLGTLGTIKFEVTPVEKEQR